MSCSESCFELGKGFISCGVPSQVFGPSLEEGCERGSHATKTLNKPPVEIGKSQKALQVLDHLGNGPFFDSGHFNFIHSHTFLTDDILQEQGLGHMKFTFFTLEVKLILKEM